MITLDRVSHGFGGTPLFSELSLSLQAGSFHFLTGPSGAGKTTLMRLCYGDLRASSGAVRLFGQDVATLDRGGVALLRRRIGVVHQNCEFLDHLSVAENIALPLTVSDRAAEAAQNLPEILNWVGLTDRTGHAPSALSGGERQRAALARAVIGSPDMILADEPTGNVDEDMSRRLLQLLIALNQMGKTILIATHDMHMIRAMKSDIDARVLRLRDGVLTEAGAVL